MGGSSKVRFAVRQHIVAIRNAFHVPKICATRYRLKGVGGGEKLPGISLAV